MKLTATMKLKALARTLVRVTEARLAGNGFQYSFGKDFRYLNNDEIELLSWFMTEGDTPDPLPPPDPQAVPVSTRLPVAMSPTPREFWLWQPGDILWQGGEGWNGHVSVLGHREYEGRDGKRHLTYRCMTAEWNPYNEGWDEVGMTQEIAQEALERITTTFVRGR